MPPIAIRRLETGDPELLRAVAEHDHRRHAHHLVAHRGVVADIGRARLVDLESSVSRQRFGDPGVGEGELIVGERGPAPKATPTYPEITCHSLADLDILDTRLKTSFRVDAATKKLYAKTVIPFWKGRSMRDRIMAVMTPEWKDAYEAGIFTEFMEQRAPGHTVLDGKIYRKGMMDFKKDIEASLATGVEELKDDGLVTFDGDLLQVTPLGQLLVRNVAMLFDPYLLKRPSDQPKIFSRTL